MIAGHIGCLLTNVAVEIGECARLLLDDLYLDTLVIFEMPAEVITVVNIEFMPYSGRMFA
ncbi:hypothetical protein C464_16867 [Halorubrum coriense DSM 10284]|uniref:Uncharacterized protein n=1 Tax=Halorubrum coriense DSM 10284 TaxID=1227466 RepID=M0E8S1_9EURY|nr:hypothetical protein C464_16867 [Halorubrum coriense DSM 10284]